MRYSMMFLMLSLAAYAAEPKFHFKECVKVTKGFYKDCKGRVDSYLDYDKNYNVDLNCKGSSAYVSFKEEDLEATTGCQ